MDIVIACGSMPFGPTTPTVKSLGGSETAALMLAKELGKRGHAVTMFCNLPQPGAPDFFPNGTKCVDNVRYIDLQFFQAYITQTECDLFIAVRDPGLAAIPAQAKKKVLWMHDIATKRGMQRAFDQMQWTIDEVWTVSEWHKRQVSETTGFPLDNIVALRNGIVRYEDVNCDTMKPPRSKNMILYAARPERGLDNLIRFSGVMEHLPDYKLVVAMYEHFPEHMRGYYEQIFKRMKEMPNVEFIGGRPNKELRMVMQEAAAYIYPSHFEETSCIIARECCETQLPMLTTKRGALFETLGTSGVYFEDWLAENNLQEPADNTAHWCELFARFFRERMNDFNEGVPGNAVFEAMLSQRDRTDLYWDGVAGFVEKHAHAKPAKPFSRAWSMIRDGDVIPAKAYLESLPVLDPLCQWLQNQIVECYPFLYGLKTLDQHYEDIYTGKIGKSYNELHYVEDFVEGSRFLKIAEELSKLPAGSRILEVGCGAGHILGTLAKHLPQHTYVGIEFSAAAVACVNVGAAKAGRTNIVAHVADGTLPISDQFGTDFDAVIISEVLEHVIEPWDVLQKAEACVKKGGRVLITVPFGPWEPETFEKPGRWLERAHIWHVTRTMLEDMIGVKKPGFDIISLMAGLLPEHRGYGNLFAVYDADHAPIKPVDPLQRANDARPRQTAAAIIIAMNNEDTILKCLNSLDKQVQVVQIAHGPSEDRTRAIIDQWAAAHPYTYVNVIDVPKIEAYKFGFDDARNASVGDLDGQVEWLFWIDTDEYLSGDFRKYLRQNNLDSYMISQHHFTTMPRGEGCQVDRPARLIRTGRGFKAIGHIHEHFEVPTGGPGRSYLLHDVDIGHPGYVNEGVRRARFARNYPFLQWDHVQIENGEVPERKLHHFLWFRDICHNMRYAIEQKNQNRARELAQEAVEYYETHWQEMALFGPGLYMSLAYLSEAYGVLGKGVEVKLQLVLDDRSAIIGGRFENLEQLQRILAQVLKPEFEERQNRYY